MEFIKSKDNPGIKALCALNSMKKEREKTGLFICEGPKLASDALRSGFIMQELYLTDKALLKYDDIAQELIENSPHSRLITEEISKKISATEAPQGIYAVYKRLDNTACGVKIISGGKYILLAGIQDPGNLGTIIRTAEALGITALYTDKTCPELFSPKVLRASMGGVFRLPVQENCDFLGLTADMRDCGIKVYATAIENNAASVTEVSFERGAAVMIGNEGSGLTEEQISYCDESLMIPMGEQAESLNAAAAATIFIWEMTK